MAMLQWISKRHSCQFILFGIFALMQPVLTHPPVHGSASDAFIWETYLQSVTNQEKLCEENYGFLPCSNKIFGNLFLLGIYGFLMLQAATILSEGSEMLLLVSNPGIIGGLVLPILGALPDSLVILASGLAASAADAQSQVLVGMGLLAGSTVMLLTLLWGSSLVVGRCDMGDNDEAKDNELSKSFDICKTGVSTDSQTSVAAWIMIMTVLPYIVAQIPHAFLKPQYGHLFAIISCVLAFVGLFTYCAYQVSSPWIREWRLLWAKKHLMRIYIFRASYAKYGNLLQPDGNPNKEVFGKIFTACDTNDDKKLSKNELKAFLIGLEITTDDFDDHLPIEEQAKNWLCKFDISHDGYLQKNEFVNGMCEWVNSEAKSKRATQDEPTFWTELLKYWKRKVDQLEDGIREDKEVEEEEEELQQGQQKTIPNRQTIILKASLFILCGAAIAGVLSDPLVDAITNFSTATKIPPFFIAFIATPLATNFSEAISSLMFASRKKKANISMTYSQIYGAVAMNNTMCLGIFLLIVVARGLEWNFSAEVTVIAAVTIVMGAIGGTRTNFPLWMGLFALALYPLTIVMVVIFDYVLMWT